MSDQVVVSRGKLVAVADAIRSKANTTEALTLDAMADVVGSIQGQGGNPYEEVFLTGETKTYRNDTVTSIGDGVFYGSRGVVEIDFPNVTSIGSNAFRDCMNLTTANLPKVTSIDSYGFVGSESLSNVYAPNLITLGDYAFRECAIDVVRFPKLTSIGSQVFRDCSSLELVDCGLAPQLKTYTFSNCSLLGTVILRKSDKVASLANVTSVLKGTKIESGEGYVYVPKSLVESYKTATNWTTYANQIRAIEDYPEITGGL